MKKWMATFATVAAVCVVAPQAEANEASQQSEIIIEKNVHYEIFTAKNGKKEARALRVEGYGYIYHGIEIELVDEVNGIPVTEIAAGAFKGEHADDTVYGKVIRHLPRSVKVIGEGAFADAMFNELVVPGSVEYIGDRAFANISVGHLTIEKGIDHIGKEAFIVRTQSAIIPQSLTSNQIRLSYFSGVEVVVQYIPDTELERQQHDGLIYEVFTRNGQQEVRIINYDRIQQRTELYVPSQIDGIPVTEIGVSAFSTPIALNGLTESLLEKIVLPASIRKIDANAFASLGDTVIDIRALTHVEEIGEYAFSDATLLTSEDGLLLLPRTLHTIGIYAFAGTNLKKLAIHKENKSIGVGAFCQNKSLTHVTIEEGVTHIASHLFTESTLQSVTIPGSVTHIGKHAFYGNRLEELILHEGLQEIGNNAFYGNALRSVTFPKGLQKIGSQAFYGNQLTDAVFEYGLEEIGTSAFFDNKLENVTFPNTLQTIEASAFSVNHIQAVHLPNSVTHVGSGAFSSNAIATLRLSESLEMISGEAFSNNKLTELYVPRSVTLIESYAFVNNQLEDVTLERVSSIREQAFKNNKIHTLKLPSNLRTISTEAFANNELKRIVLPALVDSLGHQAFMNNQIASATIPASLKQLDLVAFYFNPIEQVHLQGSDTAVRYSLRSFQNKNGAPFKGAYVDETLKTPYANLQQKEPNGKPMTLYLAFGDTVAPEPKPEPVAKFKDIGGHWAQGAIESFTDKGYINGYPDGTFKPGAPIQRKHVARILNDVFQFEAVKPATPFADVPKWHPYYDVITAVQQAGIFSGDNGKFQPEANLTRGQLAKVLVLAAGFEPGGKSTFKDTPSTYWGTPYVSALADLAIVKGTDGFFNPHSPITRAQFVSMTSLALAEMEKRQP
ncbi:leucine-rich repeat protein [Caryophanon tenue]|uniref:SLH domain-containing protein n=1 Tax=Caryophanon tenue TaxID=33978 RepID=A0A1C0YBY5_9BACL|nr:leucine-rich repeat protein [Caryophanon tenue]OCS84660.1 hypothetical protein A6M13_03545 [Caryophanon tenue]